MIRRRTDRCGCRSRVSKHVGLGERAQLACSPKVGPHVYESPTAREGKEDFDERQEAPAGTDYQEAA